MTHFLNRNPKRWCVKHAAIHTRRRSNMSTFSMFDGRHCWVVQDA